MEAARDDSGRGAKSYDAGDHQAAFAAVAALIEKAAAPLRANPPQPAPPFALQGHGLSRCLRRSSHLRRYGRDRRLRHRAGPVRGSRHAGIQQPANAASAVRRKSWARERSSPTVQCSCGVCPRQPSRTWRESPPRTKRFLQAFCDGLNDYRKAHADECQTALEADPVQVIALLRWSDVGPSHGIVQICVNAGLKQPPPKLDFPNQSSTWVIGPSRTASGRPIVFIDPHWPAEGQTSWWEFHVHAGRLQAGGFALPGLPFVGLGYTDGAAWAGTAGGADSADVFELKVNPQQPDQYWYDDQWRDMVVRDVAIRVKTARCRRRASV